VPISRAVDGGFAPPATLERPVGDLPFCVPGDERSVRGPTRISTSWIAARVLGPGSANRAARMSSMRAAVCRVEDQVVHRDDLVLL
jgi:hypothetical protein